MKKTLLLSALAIFGTGFFYSSFSQISTGGQPLSFNSANNLNNEEIPEEAFEALDLARLADEDYENEMNGGLPRFAKLIEAGFNLNNSGVWKTMPDGGRVWRLKIISQGAKATSLYYDDFFLPEGSSLFLWNHDGTQVIGSFSNFNNHESRLFATELIYGEICYLEYYEPASQIGNGVISISHIGYAYRYVYESPVEERGSSSCQVDINCNPEGTNWQNQKRGVVRIQVVSSGGAGWCSGSVVNNTSWNCIPYVLSAYHCGTSSSTSDFNQYIFYFNYERTGCGTGSSSTSQSMTGCSKKADSNDGGGNSGSDFMLLQINNNIPSNYNPYYNGWNANNTASPSGVSIHHPAGDRKKISTYTQSLTTSGWGTSNTHWRVRWAATTNGHGVTEGGSSGSPLFDNNKRICGTLTGGSSTCSSPTSYDYYGKMSWHWTNNPNTAAQKLKAWLDPTNTGTLTLDGTFAPCQQVPSLDAGISAIISPSGTYCSNTFTPVVTLHNYGSTTLTSVTITYNVDGGANSNFNWTGSLATNATANVTLPAVTSTPGAHTFNVSTTSPNGGTDGDNTNNSASSSFTINITNNAAYLILNTDNNGSQTTWQVRDGNNNVVASGGPYGNNIQVIEQICLNDGCYTFTINDSGNNGICCSSGNGSYSLGDTEGIGFITGGTFTSSESTAFCLGLSGNCDTIVNPNFAAGTPVIYLTQNGYVTGNNNFGDKAKAQVFNVTNPVYVQDVLIWFGAKTKGSTNNNSAVSVNLYALDGPGITNSGNTNTAPGTVLATTNLLLSRIDTSGFINKISFTNPVLLSANYAAGVDFSTLAANDYAGIVSSTDGQALLTELAWEKWSDNTWHTILQGWTNTINGDIDLAIFPIECPNIITEIEEKTKDFVLFPNPANDEFNIVFTETLQGLQTNCNIYSSQGQLVYSQNLNAQISTVSAAQFAAGVYFVEVEVGENKNVKKLVVRK